MKKIKLTELEKEFLNVFGAETDLDDAVYFCRLYDFTEISENQASGVASSLTRKGIIQTDGVGTDDHCVWLTPIGIELKLSLKEVA